LPGNDEFINSLQFSLRNKNQYAANDFKLHKATWQVLLDRDGKSEVWDEPSVIGPRGDTYPHPGRENWIDDDCFIEFNLTNFNLAAGYANSRDNIGNIGSAEIKKKLNSSYLVVLQENK